LTIKPNTSNIEDIKPEYKAVAPVTGKNNGVGIKTLSGPVVTGERTSYMVTCGWLITSRLYWNMRAPEKYRYTVRGFATQDDPATNVGNKRTAHNSPTVR
jgi:hypothetical protein